MSIVHPASLADTLDITSEAYFNDSPLPSPLRQEIAMWIISRQVQSGANAGYFIPFAAETETRARLFTGELLHTNLARRHIQLIEAARVLKLLGIEHPAAVDSIRMAYQCMDTMCYSQFCAKGECKVLTIAYLRLLSLDGVPDSVARLASLFARLSDYRDGRGKWNGFPYFYMLLMLTEVDHPLADQELEYTLPVCNKLSSQVWPSDSISKRRQAIITHVLARS